MYYKQINLPIVSNELKAVTGEFILSSSRETLQVSGADSWLVVNLREVPKYAY
jgi:hypothetical protein